MRTAVRCLIVILIFWLADKAIAYQADEPLTAELVITGGKVVTMDDAMPVTEAIAVRGNRILDVGSKQEISRWIGPKTQHLALSSGQIVIPGLIEGHGHYVGFGESLMILDLASAESYDAIVAQVAAAAETASPGEWILGRGWHQSKWTTLPQPNFDGYPTHDALSAASPRNPVLLTHASGHMSLANAYAMQIAGVDSSTQDPNGGEILRRENGIPTGVFRETAMQFVSNAFGRDQRNQTPEQRLQRLRLAIQIAGQQCLRHGVTSFQDAGTSFNVLSVIQSMALRDELPVRLWVMVRDDIDRLESRLPRAKMIGFADDFLTVRAIKVSLDGALGPHGAWLLDPYDDLPTSTGLNTIDLDVVERTAQLAIKSDFQLCVHAIGDRANRETLDLFERVFQMQPSAMQRRWRIEHAQHLHPDDIPRFAQLGVIASMQGIHCTSDAVFVLQRLGQRRSQTGAYMWRNLLDSGAILCNGSDVPVEPIHPIASFYASVTRKLKNGTEFFPEQKMTRLEALRSYTINAAYAAFEESIKGSLVPGKLADLVVLDRDILECPEESILESQVLFTILGGKIVYSAEP